MTHSRRHTAQVRRQDLENSPAADLPPGSIEIELGVPIPGVILPPDQWARTALKRLPEAGSLDWAALFGRTAPVVLDLGCGNGRFTISSAVRRPDFDHLGIDALPVVIRYATRRANQRGLRQVRFAVASAITVLERLVTPHSVREVHAYHPQPYSGSDRQRRLLSQRFFDLVWQALEPEGTLFIQTDSRSYWSEMLNAARGRFAMVERTEPWPEDALGRTRREILSRARGMDIYRASGGPITAPEPPSANNP
jgi:tRNA (guanine-N7-)-methyltransferase